MALLVHPSKIPPVPDGTEVLPAGFFRVPKDEFLRAFTNRNGRNGSQLAMRIANLRPGSMFCQGLLRPGQYARVNLDDLSVFS